MCHEFVILNVFPAFGVSNFVSFVHSVAMYSGYKIRGRCAFDEVLTSTTATEPKKNDVPT